MKENCFTFKATPETINFKFDTRDKSKTTL